MNKNVEEFAVLVEKLESEKAQVKADVSKIDQSNVEKGKVIELKDRVIEGLTRELKNLSYQLEKSATDNDLTIKEELEHMERKFECELNKLAEQRDKVEMENEQLKKQLGLLSMNLNAFKESRREYELSIN